MYKGRSASMQRGAGYRKTEQVDMAVLYAEMPPALTKNERTHFELGNKDATTFVDRIRPSILDLVKAGFRKPRDVSRLLNKQRVTTARGAQWTPRLAWFLLCLIFDGQLPRQMPQSGSRLIVPKPVNRRNPLPDPTPSSRQSQPLTDEEVARRLANLGRVVRPKK